MKILPIFLLAGLLVAALVNPDIAQGSISDLSHNNYIQILFQVWFAFLGILSIVSILSDIKWKQN